LNLTFTGSRGSRHFSLCEGSGFQIEGVVTVVVSGGNLSTGVSPVLEGERVAEIGHAGEVASVRGDEDQPVIDHGGGDRTVSKPDAERSLTGPDFPSWAHP
jgi:hypothetical protein